MPNSKPCGRGHISARLKCHAQQGSAIVDHSAAWATGKVAGVAISNLALAHGIDPSAAAVLGESIVQGLASTAIAAKKGVQGQSLVKHFLSVAAGAMVGKASIGTDDAIFGGDSDVSEWVKVLASNHSIDQVAKSAMKYSRALHKRVGLKVDSDDDRDLFMLSVAARRVSQLRKVDSMDIDFVTATLDKYGLSDRFDAKKVLLKMGGRRPGKHCIGKAGGKGSYIAADKQCAGHKGADGKLTAAGKQSARELAARVRDRKGMQDRHEVKVARMPLNDFIGEQRYAKTAKQIVPMMTKIHGEARSELNKRRINGGRAAIVDKKSAIAPSPSIKPQIAPTQLNAGDRRQAVAYNQQGAERAKSEGRLSDGTAWDVEAKSARISDVRSAKRQKSTSQGEMFGIEETTDLPLFRKRKDSRMARFDRAIAGGKAIPRSTRKKHNCTTRSHQCGSVCIPLTNQCRDGSVSSAQTRLKKLKMSGADDFQVQRAKNSIKERTAGKRAEINDKRIGSLRNRVKNATLAGAGKSEGLAELDPHSIEVDPKRFQYKIIGEHTATGSVGSLSGVRKYDPNLAGILQVWKDPKDGKTYVVNGHNRLDLGKKLGAESVAVRYLKAPDARTARSIGALTNIAEGRGDALDAAKFFRDTGISKEDLSAKGIPMREKIATDGLALSKLDDSLFRRTIDGEIPMARAAIIGGSGLEPAQQRDLMTLIDKEGKKKNLTDGAISEMVDIAKSSRTHQESTMSLFGEESVTKSNMIEKAKLQAAIKQRLSREKNLFGTVSRGRAASELARGGNTIDREKSGDLSTQASQSLKTFDQMKNLSGPISDAINHAASRMANGESQKSVEKDLYAKITSIDVFSGTKRRAA